MLSQVVPRDAAVNFDSYWNLFIVVSCGFHCDSSAFELKFREAQCHSALPTEPREYSHIGRNLIFKKKLAHIFFADRELLSSFMAAPKTHS